MAVVEDVVPTFFVADVARALEWYQRVLGFAATFRHGTYAGIRLGAAAIHLAQIEGPRPGVVFKGACYLRLRSGIEHYVAEIEARGGRMIASLKDHPDYGMRESTIRDPDGNDIFIGQPIAATVATD